MSWKLRVHQDSDQDEALEAYADEPLADEEWLALYEEEKRTEEELEDKLKKRLSGTEETCLRKR